MNDKWEYLVIDLLHTKEIQKQQDALNKLGKEGWELVAVTPTSGWGGNGIMSQAAAYLKRKIG